MTDAPKIGDRVRFAPNPGKPAMIVEGRIVRRRWTNGPNSTTHGWFDVMGDDGFERSVRPSRVEVIE